MPRRNATKDTINNKEMVKLLSKYKIKAHISHAPIKKITEAEQELIYGFNMGGRPNGLWYSIGGDWLDYLVSQSGLQDRYRPCCYLYSLELDYTKILCLNSVKKFKKFDKTIEQYWIRPGIVARGASYLKNAQGYGASVRSLMGKPSNEKYLSTLKKSGMIYTDATTWNDTAKILLGFKFNKNDTNYYRYPRWDQLTKVCYGVEFNPYFQSLRKNHFWYWTLDVPSGCIWNPKGVKKLELIAHKPKKSDDEDWVLTTNGTNLLKN